MATRLISDEALVLRTQSSLPETQDGLTRRMMPGINADRQDRAQAWAEWQAEYGEHVLTRFVRAHNSTHEADDDIIQDALLTAYLGVECGRYEPRAGVPFTAYVVGIARNKIREARRRDRFRADVDDEPEELERRMGISYQRMPERAIERREQHSQLRGGLSRLPAARRQVIEDYLSGASTGEIADRLEMSEALVRQHKCRGLHALQRVLQGSGDGAGDGKSPVR